MRTATIKIRVAEEELAAWRGEAARCRVGLSEWARTALNVESGFGGRAGSKKLMPKIEVAGGVHKRRGEAKAVVAEVLGRGVVVEPVLREANRDVPSARVRSVGRKKPAREVAAVVPEAPGESEVSEVFAVHTAASHRLTCGCKTCTAWRKANDIPLGGLLKKEKRAWGTKK